MKKRFTIPLLLGFVGLLFKPVALPFKVAGFIGGKTVSVAGKTAKAGLRNVSVQSGFIKIRPFDFQ